MGTTSKSCSGIGGPRIKTPKILSTQGVAHVKRVDVQKPHMSEPVRKNEDTSFDANELASKPALSLDMTPKTSLFPLHGLEQGNQGRLTKSLKIFKKLRNPLTFPAPTSCRKSKSLTMSVSENQGSFRRIRKVESVSELEMDSGPHKISAGTEDGKNQAKPRTKVDKFYRGKQKPSIPEFTSSKEDERKKIFSVSENQGSFMKIKKVENVSGTELEKDSEPQKIFARIEDCENELNPHPRSSNNTVNRGKQKSSMAEFTSSEENIMKKMLSVSENQLSFRKIEKVENVSGTTLEMESENEMSPHSRTNYDKVKKGKQKPSIPEFTPSKESKKKKMFSSCAAVSPQNQRCDQFSENIFSQSLFEDNLEGQSAAEEKPKDEKANLNEKELTERCENVPNTNNRNIGKWLACKKTNLRANLESVEANNSGLLQHVKNAGGRRSIVHKSCTSADVLQDSVVQNRSGDNLFLQGEIRKNTPINASKGDKITSGSEADISANCFSNKPLMNSEAQNGHVSSIVNTYLLEGESGMPATLSSEKVLSLNIKQNETVNNLSCLDGNFKSRFQLETNNKSLQRQNKTAPLVTEGNIAGGRNKALGHKDCSHTKQRMKLQPEAIEDILKDFPQIAKLLANELKVKDTDSMLKREYETENANNEAERQKNTTKQEVENLQSPRDAAKKSLSDDLISSPHPQNGINEVHSSPFINPTVPGICLQVGSSNIHLIHYTVCHKSKYTPYNF